MKNKRANVRADLIDVALGKMPADVVIKDGRLVNVNTLEINEHMDVAIKGNRIALVGDGRHCIENVTEVINANGKFLIPGLIDSHFHIESTMLTVSELAKVLVPRGVTAIMQDPHEIANVLGIKGIELIQDEAENTPLRAYLRVPGQIPAVPSEAETNGVVLSLEETKQLLCREDAVALAGDVNAFLVLNKDKTHLQKIDYALSLNKTVAGQALGLGEKKLNAFIAGGPQDCHVSYSAEEALSKIRKGMRAILCHRPGHMLSEAELKKFADLAEQHRLDLRLCLLCIDDKQTSHLVREGGLDYLVRLAIQLGFDPLKAIQMATINAAEHFNVTRDLGSISPGKLADIVILHRLEDISVDKVIVDGKVVAENGELTQELPGFTYPQWSQRTMHIQKKITPEDLELKTSSKQSQVKTRIISAEVPEKVIAGEVPKKVIIRELKTEDGKVIPQIDEDILHLAVIERHKATGNIGRAFIKGTGIKHGAIATSVAHDAHNISVVGANLEDMALAVNRLAEIGGGFIALRDGKVLGQVELPLAGLISLKPAKVVAEQLSKLEHIVINDLGCTLGPNPFFQLATITLPNIPDIGITDKGLFDVLKYRIIDNFVQ